MSSINLEGLEIKEATPSIAPSIYESFQYTKKWRIFLALAIGICLIGICVLVFYLSAESKRPEGMEEELSQQEKLSILTSDDAMRKWRMSVNEECFASTQRACPKEFGEVPVFLLVLGGLRIDQVSEIPSLHEFVKCGASARSLVPSYPSFNYPNLYSIATGLYPESHGIVSYKMYDEDINMNFTVGSPAAQNTEWWKGEPIWNTLGKNDRKTATYLWPGSNVKIQGRYPTYWQKEKIDFQIRIRKVVDWIQLPKEERPQLIMMYYEEPVTTALKYGPFSPKATAELIKINSGIDELMASLQRLNLFNCVNVIVASAHGVAASSCENSIQIDELVNETIPGRVYTGSVGRIDFFKDTSQSTIERITEKLQCKDSPLRTLKKKQVPKRYHYTKGSRIGDLLLDTRPGSRVATESDSKCLEGEFGYDILTRSMQGVFIAQGPNFRVGFKTKSYRNVEIYNLLSHILSVEPAPNNGTRGSLFHLLKMNFTTEKDFTEPQKSYLKEIIKPLPTRPNNAVIEKTSKADEKSVKCPCEQPTVKPSAEALTTKEKTTTTASSTTTTPTTTTSSTTTTTTTELPTTTTTESTTTAKITTTNTTTEPSATTKSTTTTAAAESAKNTTSSEPYTTNTTTTEPVPTTESTTTTTDSTTATTDSTTTSTTTAAVIRPEKYILTFAESTDSTTTTTTTEPTTTTTEPTTTTTESTTTTTDSTTATTDSTTTPTTTESSTTTTAAAIRPEKYILTFAESTDSTTTTTTTEPTTTTTESTTTTTDSTTATTDSTTTTETSTTTTAAVRPEKYILTFAESTDSTTTTTTTEPTTTTTESTTTITDSTTATTDSTTTSTETSTTTTAAVRPEKYILTFAESTDSTTTTTTTEPTTTTTESTTTTTDSTTTSTETSTTTTAAVRPEKYILTFAESTDSTTTTTTTEPTTTTTESTTTTLEPTTTTTEPTTTTTESTTVTTESTTTTTESTPTPTESTTTTTESTPTPTESTTTTTESTPTPTESTTTTTESTPTPTESTTTTTTTEPTPTTTKSTPTTTESTTTTTESTTTTTEQTVITPESTTTTTEQTVITPESTTTTTEPTTTTTESTTTTTEPTTTTTKSTPTTTESTTTTTESTTTTTEQTVITPESTTTTTEQTVITPESTTTTTEPTTTTTDPTTTTTEPTTTTTESTTTTTEPTPTTTESTTTTSESSTTTTDAVNPPEKYILTSAESADSSTTTTPEPANSSTTTTTPKSAIITSESEPTTTTSSTTTTSTTTTTTPEPTTTSSTTSTTASSLTVSTIPTTSSEATNSSLLSDTNTTITSEATTSSSPSTTTTTTRESPLHVSQMTEELKEPEQVQISSATALEPVELKQEILSIPEGLKAMSLVKEQSETDKAKESELRSLHCPWGFPSYSAPEVASDILNILLHSSHIIGLPESLNLGIWTSFTIAKKRFTELKKSLPKVTKDVYASPEKRKKDLPIGCWISDSRLQRSSSDQCSRIFQTDLYENKNVSLRQLFPEEFELPGTLSDEGFLLSNLAPLRKGFEQGPRRAMLEAMEKWTEQKGPLNVVHGPVFDYDFDGKKDDVTVIKNTIKPLIPSNYFYIVSICNETKDSEDSESENQIVSFDSCPTSNLNVYSFVFPNTAENDMCFMTDREYLQYHLASLADVEGLTSLRFFKNMSYKNYLQLRARQPLRILPF